jgi:hypothetical protein
VANRRTKRVEKKAVIRTGRWKPTFLQTLADTGNVTIACNTACVGRRTAYQQRQSDAEFAKGWRESLAEAADVMKAEAHRRAVIGVDEPVIHLGKLCGLWVNAQGKPVDEHTPGATMIPLTVKKYSDVLLMFLMKAADPKTYRENVRHTGIPAAPSVSVNVTQISEDDLVRIATRGGNGTAPAAAGAAVPDRLRQRH